MFARRVLPLLAAVVGSLLLAAPALGAHTLVGQWGGPEPERGGEFEFPRRARSRSVGGVFVADTENDRIPGLRFGW